MAQIDFPVAARAADTTLTSSILTVPVGATGVDLTGIVPEPDLSDPTKTVQITIQVSYNNGPFQDLCSSAWEGGTMNRSGLVPPTCRAEGDPANPLVGQRVRLRAVTGPAMQLGATLKTLP